MCKPLMLALLGLSLTAGTAFAKTNVNVLEQNNRREIDAITCDTEDTGILEVGNSYNFNVSFAAKENKVKVSRINFWFWADDDYNGSESMVNFSETKEIKTLDGVVGRESIKLIESTPYVIKKPAEKSSPENVLIKYEILYNDILPDGSISKEQDRYVQCGRYTVMEPKK
ncbi:MAG: hypothetical protein IKN64_04450 [Desulfovibrio sp.]|nr:hypothetical protein [Desulfovibrio sp.]